MLISAKAKNIISTFFAGLILFCSLFNFALADFNPNKLIEDNQFTDTQTFGGAAGIQQFFQTKGSVLANTNADFLLKLNEPQDSKIKTALEDPEPNLGRLRSAAELIWDASLKSGLNPQVIVVTLEKEQGLIANTFNDPNNLQRALNHALGFSCSDQSGCDQLFSGFYYQLFGNLDAQGNRYIGAPASLIRSFNTANGRGPGVDANNQVFGAPIIRTSHVNDNIVIDNTQGPPNNAAATQNVTLSNLATAALYRYTPHVYNGNFNFWKFFSKWFKYQNGQLIRAQGDSKIYIISNGAKSLMLNFVMATHALNPLTANILSVSPTELSDYDTGPLYAPQDNTMVKATGDASGKLWVFENGIKHPASDFVLKQRGLDPVGFYSADQSELDMFASGALLPPNDGTLIRGDSDLTVYLIQNGKKMALTPFTFKQYGFSFKNVVVLPQSEVLSYDSGGFLLPKDGSLLTLGTDKLAYLLKDQILQPISFTTFNLWHYRFSDIVNLNADQLANAAVGSFLPPPEGTYFKTELANNYYFYKNGTKHAISNYVLKQRKIAPLAVTLGLEEGLSLPDGQALPPRDGTLIKGDQSLTIFVIKNGQKIPLDYATWVRVYKQQSPVQLSQTEVDSYPNLSDQIQQ
jgi:hypothetical protein